MPVNKLVKIGVWEDGKFIGVIIFGVGASAVIHKQFAVGRFEVAELVRIALKDHRATVSRMVAIALRMVRRSNPKLRVLVSFADPSEGHNGGIYQAGGWIYTGRSQPTIEYFYNGDWRHVTDVYKRTTNTVIRQLPNRKKQGKYRYVMPLDAAMRQQIELLRQPYPKRVRSVDGDTPAIHAGEGGSIPTRTLTDK